MSSPASQLLEHAWDYDYENRSNVVDVYVGYLRREDRPALRHATRSRPCAAPATGCATRETARDAVLPIRLRLTLAFAARDGRAARCARPLRLRAVRQRAQRAARPGAAHARRRRRARCWPAGDLARNSTLLGRRGELRPGARPPTARVYVAPRSSGPHRSSPPAEAARAAQASFARHPTRRSAASRASGGCWRGRRELRAGHSWSWPPRLSTTAMSRSPPERRSS